MREELLFHWPKVVDVEEIGPEVLNIGRYRAFKDFTWSWIKDASNRSAGDSEKYAGISRKKSPCVEPFKANVLGFIEFKNQESSDEKAT